MSTTRLTFLYPPFFRPSPSPRVYRAIQRQYRGYSRAQGRGQGQGRNGHGNARFRCLHSPSPSPYPHPSRSSARTSNTSRETVKFPTRNATPGTPGTKRCFSSSARASERMIKRHGKAVEPFLAEGESVDGVRLYTPEEKGEGEKIANASLNAKDGEGALEKEIGMGKEPSSSAPLSEETQAAARVPGDEGVNGSAATTPGSGSGKEAAAGKPEPSPSQQASTPNPKETVLHMPPPETAEESNASKPPHLQTPPYVHHFDTYTLVSQVEAGGFSNEQAITSMKAVRGLLALNLEVARRGLVSKSDVENETYLFRAACSELKTEIQNTRKKNEEAMRRERTLLQHEVDGLNQKLGQELLTLKDDLKGMFDDRKMSVRMEQRTMESKIQELNYKITVLLNSDSKSEIEGLRWVLTRRSVMGILFMAFMVLTSLRYASYKSHEDEVRKKREEEGVKELVGLNGAGGGGLGGGDGDVGGQGVAGILAAN